MWFSAWIKRITISFLYSKRRTLFCGQSPRSTKRCPGHLILLCICSFTCKNSKQKKKKKKNERERERDRERAKDIHLILKCNITCLSFVPKRLSLLYEVLYVLLLFVICCVQVSRDAQRIPKKIAIYHMASIFSLPLPSSPFISLRRIFSDCNHACGSSQYTYVVYG